MSSTDPTFKHFYNKPEREFSYFDKRAVAGKMPAQDVVEVIISRNTYGRVRRDGKPMIGHLHYGLGREERAALNSSREGDIGADDRIGDYGTVVYVPFDVEFERDGRKVKLWSYVKGSLTNSPELEACLRRHLVPQEAPSPA